MTKHRLINLFLMVIILLAGCAKKTTVPAVDVSRLDAEQAIVMAQSEIDEAEKAGADVAEPKAVLDEARNLLKEKNYSKAKAKADEAARQARILKEKMLAKIRGKEDAAAAIERASKAVSEARAGGADVLEPEKILGTAENEFKNENYDIAVELADKAYNLARELLGMLKMDTYKVGTWEADRDCLWNIAAKKEIYDDAWKWKKIYMANRDKVKDPDIIYPGQVLRIPRQ